jgi:hypothetical protein
MKMLVSNVLRGRATRCATHEHESMVNENAPQETTDHNRHRCECVEVLDARAWLNVGPVHSRHELDAGAINCLGAFA